MILNFHTHLSKFSNHCSIRNISDNFDKIPATGIFSAGIHPWYIKNNTFEIEMVQLEKALNKLNVVAVGECGLDKACKTDFQLQENCFKRQIRLANILKKPLIVHCVKAFSETITLLQKEKCSVPVIFHGFNKGKILAEQLISKGYYLSFGKHLFETRTASIFKTLPLTHIFLETDDATINIIEIYKIAAELSGTSVEILTNQIESNARLVFNQRLFLQPD